MIPSQRPSAAPARSAPQAMQAPPALDPQFDGGDSEAEFHLADYLRILSSRWRLIAIVAGLLMALSLIQYAVTPKEYRATTLIQIERRVSVPLKAVQDAWLDNWYNLEYYPTQYRLLNSRGLAERVVRNLGLNASTSGVASGPAESDGRPGTAVVTPTTTSAPSAASRAGCSAASRSSRSATRSSSRSPFARATRRSRRASPTASPTPTSTGESRTARGWRARPRPSSRRRSKR